MVTYWFVTKTWVRMMEQEVQKQWQYLILLPHAFSFSCLLTILTTKHRVLLFEPDKVTSNWVLVRPAHLYYSPSSSLSIFSAWI